MSWASWSSRARDFLNHSYARNPDWNRRVPDMGRQWAKLRAREGGESLREIKVVADAAGGARSAIVRQHAGAAEQARHRQALDEDREGDDRKRGADQRVMFREICWSRQRQSQGQGAAQASPEEQVASDAGNRQFRARIERRQGIDSSCPAGERERRGDKRWQQISSEGQVRFSPANEKKDDRVREKSGEIPESNHRLAAAFGNAAAMPPIA